MKNTIRTVIIATIIALQSLAVSGQNKVHDLKIITYNIWNGYDWGKDQDRREKVQQWLKSQAPSVVALQELCEYTPEKLKEDAEAWGHDYSVLLKTTGYSVGLTSKYPIEIKERIMEGMHHGALHGKTNGIDFLVVHLNPSSTKVRRNEAQILSKKLETISKSNSDYIVLGDFNAHSPFDADLYDPNGYFLNRLRKSNVGKGLDGNLAHEQLDYAVMSKFISLPLYDVIPKFTNEMKNRGSFPGRVLAEINKESMEQLVSRLERIDYIMVSSSLAAKCTSAKVHNGEDNWYLSDHYPVSASFKIENQSNK
ncbi:hypothetical protein HCG49_13410 [Arenibacter sp. 6A1]|uniref:endonuclease/exonuclease/phosphatase family protein n=1 Tax=Arenibacter sp. 6A1 TaxID=2720391 RepID=UPI0014471BC2|nr:endonuclease/exonuclease/phosphatase family protein [Arenibacter sp. 6A1]NKI27562.1 hypothetical protein [Arenibacter sp. 6A1]